MSKLSIANIALVGLGKTKLDSLQGDTAVHDNINVCLNTVIKSILSDGNWGFATVPANLPSTPITEDEQLNTGFTFKYLLPKNFIKYIRHYTNNNLGYSQNTLNQLSNNSYYYFSEDEYAVVGNHLFCNSSSLRIQYVADVDGSLYTEAFILACSSRLKVLIMPGFGESDVDALSFESKQSDRLVNKAKTIESKKRTNKYSIRKRIPWG